MTLDLVELLGEDVQLPDGAPPARVIYYGVPREVHAHIERVAAGEVENNGRVPVSINDSRVTAA